MVWIEPLSMREIFINVLSGDTTYFASIAIFAILTLAGTFRMTGLTLGFMLFVFLFMFSGFINPSLLIFISIIGGVLVGYFISRIVKN
jgi:hypothetical protein